MAMEQPTKQCRDCKQLLPLTAFQWQSTRQRRASHCHDCRRRRGREAYAKHREKRREAAKLAQRRRRAADPDGMRKKHQAYVCKNPARIRRLSRQNNLKKFGISVADYEARYQAQQGRCAICGQPERVVNKGKLKQLAVDHDHDTGTVRGLLCSACNIGIGCLRHDPERLQAAIAYLQTGS